MSENLITWNVPNWITVIIMVTVGFFAFGFIGNVARGFQSDNESAA